MKKRPIDIEDHLKREIERLQEAKRRALAVADERAKEAVELRLENERLRAQLAECDRIMKRRRRSHPEAQPATGWAFEIKPAQ